MVTDVPGNTVTYFAAAKKLRAVKKSADLVSTTGHRTGVKLGVDG